MSPKSKPKKFGAKLSAKLSAAELTALAVKAMRSGRDDDALEYLGRAIDADPADGNPHHLIGAILASRGESAKAIQALTQALTLNPQSLGVRWQLGLLHFTNGQVIEAQSVWQAYDDLDERHPLRLFRKGMLHLAKDQFEDCIAQLELGISLCETESINKDMRRVIDRVHVVVAANPVIASPDQEQHVMLARYGQMPQSKQ